MLTVLLFFYEIMFNPTLLYWNLRTMVHRDWTSAIVYTIDWTDTLSSDLPSLSLVIFLHATSNACSLYLRMPKVCRAYLYVFVPLQPYMLTLYLNPSCSLYFHLTLYVDLYFHFNPLCRPVLTHQWEWQWTCASMPTMWKDSWTFPTWPDVCREYHCDKLCP